MVHPLHAVSAMGDDLACSACIACQRGAERRGLLSIVMFPLDHWGQSSSASLPVYVSPENEQKIYQALQISLYFCPAIAATLFPQILRVGRSRACLGPLNGRHNVCARGHYVCAMAQTPPSRDCVTDGGTWPAGCTGGGRRQEVAWAPSPARPYGIPSPQAWDDCDHYACGLQHYGTDFALGNF
jgi:hypothetical protein